MATEQQSEKSPLIGSPVFSPELDQVSMDEPARNKLDSDPNILTSFDDKKVSSVPPGTLVGQVGKRVVTNKDNHVT